MLSYPTIRFIVASLILQAVSAFAFGQVQETVLYSFRGYDNGYAIGDGINPGGSIVFDGSGKLYGVTGAGGPLVPGSSCFPNGCGTVYQLTPSSGGWGEKLIYVFCPSGRYLPAFGKFPPIEDPCPDGYAPYLGLVSDGAGNLYGTAQGGGFDQGVVFELSPPVVGEGPWTETVLWSFGANGSNDPDDPTSVLTIDGAGNLYGVTAVGGNYRHGTVYELSPTPDGGWTQSVLHSFGNGDDGYDPSGGVIFDAAGNLYGTTYVGGGSANAGIIYKLTPQSDSSWAETVLYTFDHVHSGNPTGNLTMDQAGNLYGSFLSPIPFGGVFQLSQAGIQWFIFNGKNGADPFFGVFFDSADQALISTTGCDTDCIGNIFEIQNHQETVLYNFCSHRQGFNCTDGQGPSGPLVEHAGKLYGVTAEGGNGAYPGYGLVYSISQ